MHVYIQMRVCMYVFVFVSVCLCVYIYICMYLYIYIYIYIYIMKGYVPRQRGCVLRADPYRYIGVCVYVYVGACMYVCDERVRATAVWLLSKSRSIQVCICMYI